MRAWALGLGLGLVHLLGLGLGLVGVASAEPLKVGPAQIELDPLWNGPPVAIEGSPLLVRRRDGALLTVTRAAAPNTAAWRSATRTAYLDEVEAGLLAAGATKLGAKRKQLGKDSVPVLDVTVRRQAPDGTTEIVAVRLLLFRTVTIAAAAAAPDSRAGRTLAEAAVATLVPQR